MLTITEAVKEQSLKLLFSWKLSGNEGQKSYELKILDAKGSCVYNTGVVEDYHRHNIPCETRLSPNAWYTWKLQVTGTAGGQDHFQGGVFFTENDAWKALWVEPDRERKPLTDSKTPPEPIGRSQRPADGLDKLDPAVYMRKTFTLEEIPEFALAHVTAHGIYELYVNGTLVSDLLAPTYTSYGKRLEYQSYDVTPYLQKGENVIGAILADGWYTGKIGAIGIGQQFGKESALLFQINAAFADGSRTAILSDVNMKWSTGAIRYADLYIGEYYDANEEKTGWLSEGYDDSDWNPVRIAPYGYEVLVPQTVLPIREVRTIKPALLTAPNGDLLLDAGENIVGYVAFTLSLKKGQKVTLEHSETVDKEGNYLQNIIGQNKNQTDYYVADKDGVHSYKPRFAYHGFRYVRVSGAEDIKAEDFTIRVIATPLTTTGNFCCDDERLNTLSQIILRSQQGNMIGIPTDCPQRERTGWTGDAQLYTPTGAYVQNIEHFMRHWLTDMRNEQLPDGQVPHIVPYMWSHDVMKPPGIEGVSAAGWSDAAIIVPWRLYEAYGDVTILEENYPMMKAYMDATRRMAWELPQGAEEMDEAARERQHYLWNTGFQYGDWLMPSIQMSGRPIFEVVVQTGYIVATLQYAMITDMMARICRVLGKHAEAEEYIQLNKKIRTAWAEEYMDAEGNVIKDYQGVYVLALYTGAIPEQYRAKALARLTELIHENNDLLDTGFLSVPYLLPVLYENGEQELAETLLLRDECPSWLYEVKMGATTMWEYWNGYAPDGTPSDCSMNHFAFGCVGKFMYDTLAGIRPAEPGFRRVIIEPFTTGALEQVKGCYDSIWGEIQVCWDRKGDAVNGQIMLPPDVEAEVRINGKTLQLSAGNHVISL